MGQEVLHYENITFRRDGKEILTGVDWHVEEGENWALLGLNGAGKSTMLSFIPAYQTATSGVLRVLGKEFGKHIWTDIKERVGFVSSSMNQFVSTMNKQTIENIVVSGAYNTIGIYRDVEPAVRQKALGLLDEFNMTKRKEALYKTCSMGEQRRALLARAIMSDPDLLILDEPCSGLDLSGRESFLKTLSSLATEFKKPYVYVTHQIEEIMPPITHVALLKDGAMFMTGTKEEVINERVLSDLYGVALRVEWENGRPWVIVK